MLTFSNLQEALIVRSKDKLSAVNILKRRLIELHLIDKQQEASHILSNALLHNVPESDLIENLLAISNIKEAEIEATSVGDSSFSASLDEDSAFFEFLFKRGGKAVRLLFNTDAMQEILLERTGLGVSGESYIVNENHRLMSASIFYKSEYPTNITSNTEGVLMALEGGEEVATYPDYRGVEVMGAFRPIEFHGIKMALLTEIDMAEVMIPIYQIRNNMVALGALLLLLSFIISVILGRLLSTPILKLREVADQLSLGALPSNIRSTSAVLEMEQISHSMDRLIHSLKKIASFAGEIGEGRMQAEYTTLSKKDELGKAILRMRDQLIQLNNEKTSLELNSKKILIEAQEKDRERISRDLHDGLGALLTTIKLKMENSGLFSGNEEMKELIERTISETRSLARNLMPSVLRDFGLNEALEQLIDDIQHGSSIRVHYFNELERSEVRLEKEKQVYIYRIVQEAFNNAIKHSQCTELQLSVTVFDDHIALFVKDNGVGFDVTRKSEFPGLGLRNIEERVRVMNGILYIESDTTGTGIEIEIPIV